MKVSMKLGVLGMALGLQFACGGKSADDSGVNGGDPGGSNAGGSGASANAGMGGSSVGGSAAAPTIYLYDENNYRTETSLSVPTVETASDEDIDVCWTKLVSDLDCNPIDPQSGVDAIDLFKFRGLSEGDVETLFAAGEITASNLDGYFSFDSDHSSRCTKLSSFSAFGTEVDVGQEYTESPNHTYLFLFTRGTTAGLGSASMAFGRPVTTSMNAALDAPAGCGIRSFSADVASTVPVAVLSEGPWIVDWSKLTRAGTGSRIQFSSIDGLKLWFVAGATPDQVENQVTQLDLIASLGFHLPLGDATRADLAEAQSTTTSEKFSGFQRSGEGTWLLGLTCSACVEPAPIVLVVLQPMD